jgi:hypothetical protein
MLSDPVSKMHVTFKLNNLHFTCLVSHSYMHAQQWPRNPWSVTGPYEFFNIWSVLLKILLEEGGFTVRILSLQVL